VKLVRRCFGVALVLAIVCVQAIGLHEAHAGAWNRAQWGYYLQLGTSFTTSIDGQRFTGTGDKTDILVSRSGTSTIDTQASNFQQLLTDLYFEVGLLPRFTLIGDLTFVSARQRNPGAPAEYKNHGIGDLMFGGRIQILQKPVAFAFEGRLYVPTGDTIGLIPLGSGDYRGDMRLALGKSWSDIKVPVYGMIEVGTMLRGTATVRDVTRVGTDRSDVTYAPEVFFHTEFGLTVLKTKNTDRLLVIGMLDYRSSTRRRDVEAFSLTPATQEILSYGGTVMAFLWRGLGLSVRATHVPLGRNTLNTVTVAGAVFASF
jgi:hypothetical protein